MSQDINSGIMGAFCPFLFSLIGGVSISNNNNLKKGNETQVNEEIRAKEMLVITNTGEKLGTLSKAEALNEAYDRDMDLVLVSPDSNPPVAKMMDYSRFRFEQQKKAKEAKKKQKIIVVQEIQLSPTIEKHDFDTKGNKAKTILQAKGNKIKVTCRLKGRMLARKELGFDIVNKFVESLADVASVETETKIEGKTVYAVIAPKKEIKKGE